jgi:hypothetical protein
MSESKKMAYLLVLGYLKPPLLAFLEFLLAYLGQQHAPLLVLLPL